MKNYLPLLFLIFVAKTWAQEVHFDVNYLPYHSYVLSKAEKTISIVDIEASEEIFEALKSQGIEVPIIEKENSSFKSITTTGEQQNDKISIKGEFLEFSQAIQLESAIFYGFFQDKRVKVDSLSSDVLNENEKMSITTSIQNVLNQIYFPDKKMKIGDSLVETTNLNYPIGEEMIPLSIATIYKLKAANAEKAFFDLILNYNFTTEFEGSKTTAYGSGIGSIEYDIEKKFITRMLLDTEILIDFKQNEMLFHTKVTTELDQNVAVNFSGASPRSILAERVFKL